MTSADVAALLMVGVGAIGAVAALVWNAVTTKHVKALEEEKKSQDLARRYEANAEKQEALASGAVGYGADARQTISRSFVLPR